MKSIKYLVMALLVPAAWASAAPAPAHSINVTVINQELANILKASSDPSTKLSAGLYGAAVDAQRATYLKGYLSAERTNTPATQNSVIPAALDVNYQYLYAEGQAKPEFDVDASLIAKNGSMSKILLNTLNIQPNQMDSFFLKLQKVVLQSAQGFLKKYGTAATVTTSVSGVEKNKANHYVAENLALSLTIDTAHLPALVSRDEVRFSTVNLQASLNLNTGVEIKASVLMNPDYIEFQHNQAGLKQYLESLEKNDSPAVKALSSYVLEAKEFITAATTNQPSNSN